MAIVWPVWALKAAGAVQRVPREVWYALAAFVAWWLFSAHYINVGRAELRAELEQARDEAKAKAEAADQAVRADDAEKREAFKETEDVLEKVIDDAEKNDRNPLDDLLSGSVWGAGEAGAEPAAASR